MRQLTREYSTGKCTYKVMLENMNKWMEQSLKVETFKKKKKIELWYWSNLIDELKNKNSNIYKKRHGSRFDKTHCLQYKG